MTVSFDVTNTGTRAGAEVAEVYEGEAHAKVSRPVRELKSFAKVPLSSGETRHVPVTLDRRAFSYYDAGQHNWEVDAGDFQIYVGHSSAQIDLTGKVLRAAQWVSRIQHTSGTQFIRDKHSFEVLLRGQR